MIIISCLKRVLVSLLSYYKETHNLSKLQGKYPNCEFYPGAKISHTTFENFNIVFNDVLIDCCKIGAHTYIQKRSAIFNSEIGKFCSIASGVSIGPGIHKTDGISTHPAFYLHHTPLIKKFSDSDLFESSKRTKIGHDVWIGERAVIIDGLTIGNGAIIAAGSVVTKNVDAYAVVGGVPARVIKYRFDPPTIERLLESKWWDRSEEWLKSNHLSFSDPDSFFKIN